MAAALRRLQAPGRALILLRRTLRSALLLRRRLPLAHTRQLLSIVKALVPATLQRIADQAMQLHGAAGLCADTPLVHIFAAARILRIADGPDAVHWRKAGQMEFKQQRSSRLAPLGLYTPPRDANEPHFRYTSDAVSPAKQAELDAFEALMRE